MATNATNALFHQGTADEFAEFHQQLLDQSSFIASLYGGIMVAGLILLIAFTLHIRNQPLSWTGPVQRLLQRPWNVRDTGWIILPLAIAQVIVGLLMLGIQPTPADGTAAISRIALIVQTLLFHGLCLVLIISFMKQKGVSLDEAFGINRNRWGRSVIAGVFILIGIMPLVMVYNISAQMLLQWFGHNPKIQDAVKIFAAADTPGLTIYMTILAVVIAPVVEEMLFRGILLPAFAKVIGLRAALVLVGILFALVHGLYLPSALVFFILSMAFSLGYIYHRSLLTPIVMHAIFNGFSTWVILRM